MRIVFAADTYKPYISGVTIYISQHMAELKRQGHEVSLVTFGSKGDTHEKGVLVNPGVPLKVGYVIGLRYTPPSLDSLRSADVIHIHHPFLTGQLVLNAVRNQNIPLVCTVHTRYDEYLHDYMPWLPEKAGWKILGAYLPGFYRKMDRVICNSDASEQGLRNCGVRSEVVRIPNGIELGPFLSARTDPALRRRLGGEGKTLFLYVGRLSQQKNLSLLLEAFTQSLRKGCNAHLALIGSGPSVADLKHMAERLGISDNVTFTGQLPFEELPAYYASADAFVMPSIHDSHPLVVMEAMAAGLGVLAVKSPAYADTVFPEVNGFLVDNDAGSFAAALEIAAANDQMRCRMGQCAREISERFSIEISAERLVDLYTSVIEDKRRQ